MACSVTPEARAGKKKTSFKPSTCRNFFREDLGRIFLNLLMKTNNCSKVNPYTTQFGEKPGQLKQTLILKARDKGLVLIIEVDVSLGTDAV